MNNLPPMLGMLDDLLQLEQAVDRAQEAQALFTNFDASVYTIIFIPTDASGVLPPGAEKYLKQVTTVQFQQKMKLLLDSVPYRPTPLVQK